jgi:hypothetical protein
LSNKRKLPTQRGRWADTTTFGEAPADKVLLAYLTRGTVHDKFMRSILGAVYHDSWHNRRLFDGGGVAGWVAGANLSDPRNKIVAQFRALTSEPEWLLFVDDDMVFEPDAIDRLVESADPLERPIVGGVCFGLSPEVGELTMLPTMYDIGQDANGAPAVMRHLTVPPGGVVRVAGTGTGFLLIHRGVFDKFDAANDGSGFSRVFPYFQESLYGDKPIGEDLTFCFRAGLLDIPVHVDTSIHIGHMKERELTFAAHIAEFEAAMGAQNEAG